MTRLPFPGGIAGLALRAVVRPTGLSLPRRAPLRGIEGDPARSAQPRLVGTEIVGLGNAKGRPSQTTTLFHQLAMAQVSVPAPVDYIPITDVGA